ncbi:general secretion pathway protein K [Piscinibacter sakaiensis]|uniref:Type II secretion system protein K n=2 Tax=Piscinibacter sakaiensis TaxID=1547922 RepID=A0A0K8NVY3_PISS1|nr:general secretion pathway protein K [Piscinibacter sakaiensis]
MLIMALVTTLAGTMLWQQWRAVQVEAAERARTQSAWILAGALDWARLILREDARNGGPDHLGEPWAVPLAEARLSSFLAADKDSGVVPDDGPEAFLSGAIIDAQSRYNLANLVSPDGQVLRAEVEALQRLFELIDVPPTLATGIAAGLRDAALTPAQAASAATPASGVLALPIAAQPPLRPKTLDQLAWFGVDADALRRMRPYVELLPASGTKVNVNTAPREVLAAVVPGLDLAGAQRLAQARERSPFRDLAQVSAQLGNATLPLTALDVQTAYFEVRGRLRLDDRVLEERSLVRRTPQREVTVLTRERIAAHERLP